MWRKQGISPGWRIVDINGVDTKEMTAVAWRSFKKKWRHLWRISRNPILVFPKILVPQNGWLK